MSETGGGAPYDVLGFVRKYIPFSHFPFRNNMRDGLGQLIQTTFASPNVDTNFTLSLGRVPSRYVIIASSVGGVVYNGSNQGTDWTPNKIVLRASVAGFYRLWVA